MSWDKDCEYIDTTMFMSISIWMYVCIDRVYSACSMMFIVFKTLVDIVILDIQEFNVILGMSWLSPYYVILNYYTKLT